jgi:hypothetical protein
MHPELRNKDNGEHQGNMEGVKKAGETVGEAGEKIASAEKVVGKVGGVASKALAFAHLEGAATKIVSATEKATAQLGKLAKWTESGTAKAVGEAGKGAARLAEGVMAYGVARERGTSPVASVISAVAQDVLVPAEGAIKVIDGVAGLAQKGIEHFAPGVAEYTSVLAENTPGKTLKNLVAVAVDMADDVAGARTGRVVENLETGKYGAIGSVALGADALKAVVRGDSMRFATLTDRAAAGDFGVAASGGSSLGEWAGKHFPVPQSVLHLLNF